MEIKSKVEFVGGDKLQGGDRWWRYKVEMVGGDSVSEGKRKFIVIVITLLSSECTYVEMIPNGL